MAGPPLGRSCFPSRLFIHRAAPRASNLLSLFPSGRWQEADQTPCPLHQACILVPVLGFPGCSDALGKQRKWGLCHPHTGVTWSRLPPRQPLFTHLSATAHSTSLSLWGRTGKVQMDWPAVMSTFTVPRSLWSSCPESHHSSPAVCGCWRGPAGSLLVVFRGGEWTSWPRLGCVWGMCVCLGLLGGPSGAGGCWMWLLIPEREVRRTRRVPWAQLSLPLKA